MNDFPKREINGDVHRNCDLIFGVLFGWDMREGFWMIEVMTKEGITRLSSSDSGSEAAVNNVRRILRAEDGLKPPQGWVGMQEGQLVFKPSTPWHLGPEICFDPYENIALRSLQMEANVLAHLFGSTEALLDSLTPLRDAGGIELLAQGTSITFACKAVLSWSRQLVFEDVNMVCAAYANAASGQLEVRCSQAMNAKYPNCADALQDVEFELMGHSGEEVYSFHMFFSNVGAIFCDAFRILFIDPAWAVDRIGRGF